MVISIVCYGGFTSTRPARGEVNPTGPAAPAGATDGPSGGRSGGPSDDDVGPPIDDDALAEDPAAAEATRSAAGDDPSFGPLVEIETITIDGLDHTADRLVRRALLVREGDRLRTGDPRFRVSRFRVLALGYFYDVRLRLERGSARGRVVVVVEVWERGTFIVNGLYFGTASEASPLWLGADVADANFLGSGLTVGAALVWADAPDGPGGDDQLALRLRYGDPSVSGWPIALGVESLWSRAILPVTVDGGGTEWVPHTRAGGSLSVGWDLTRQLRAVGQLRLEALHLGGGSASAQQRVLLDEGDSVLGSLTLGLDRDTRADPVLTQAGDRAVVLVEAGGLVTNYDFVRVRGRYQRWVPVRGERHVVSIHLGAGAVFGEPAGFDRFFVGDIDKMVPPRPLDLVVSTRDPPDLLGLSVRPPRFGDVAAAAEIQYGYRLFRRTGHIYGGDLFVGIGLAGLWNRTDTATAGDRTIDLTIDAGLRLDSEIGVFELSLANALARVPL